MTKAEIVESISREVDVQKKDIAFVIDSFFEKVKGSLSEGDPMELRGFGTFGYKIRKGRKARNPRSGEAVVVDDRVVIFFKPGKEFKQLAKLVPVEKIRSMVESRKRGPRGSKAPDDGT
ncbi:MAG TPA: HU family DNA-binding protein [Spirochaetota bacterium]|nr:HU family DNA-binding protein [Spirochaetota bacterium]HPN83371.1 HU family DNA-binding protein [Spirochaetota bacterium]